MRSGLGPTNRKRADAGMVASSISLADAFTRDSSGVAGIELALGAAMLLAVSTLCFDLYSRIRADTATARMAVTMADYVSRDTEPDGDDMDALGRYLHSHELGVPGALVYVVSALHQPPGDPLPEAVVLWTDSTIRIGDTEVTENIASACPQFGAEGEAADLPDEFTMLPNEVVVIAEVCVRLTREGSLTGTFVAGDIYRLHALRARETEQTPAKPVYVDRSDPIATSLLDAVERGGAGTARRLPNRLSMATARA